MAMATTSNSFFLLQALVMYVNKSPVDKAKLAVSDVMEIILCLYGSLEVLETYLMDIANTLSSRELG